MVTKRRLRSFGGVGRRSPKPSGRRGRTRVPIHAGGGMAPFGAACRAALSGEGVGVGEMMMTAPLAGGVASGWRAGAVGALESDGAVDAVGAA